MTNVALSGLVGLLIGGILGAMGFALLHQIRTGRIKLAVIHLGPIKIDLTGLNPKVVNGAAETDWSSMGPFIEISGSLATGCLALIAAGLVFLGFILPWASFRLFFLLSGAVSGLSMLIQLVAGLLLALVGTASGGDLAGLGAVAAALLIVITLFLVIIPYMGFRLGQTGLRLIQSPRLSNPHRREASRALIRMAAIGLVPTLCYLTTTTTGFAGLGSLAMSVEALQGSSGLWIILTGFTIAIVAGLVISIASALAEQIPASSPTLSSGQSRPTRPPAAPALTQEEKSVLELVAEGMPDDEIAEKLEISVGLAGTLIAELLRKFGVESKAELVRAARGYKLLPPGYG